MVADSADTPTIIYSTFLSKGILRNFLLAFDRKPTTTTYVHFFHPCLIHFHNINSFRVDVKQPIGSDAPRSLGDEIAALESFDVVDAELEAMKKAMKQDAKKEG